MKKQFWLYLCTPAMIVLVMAACNRDDVHEYDYKKSDQQTASKVETPDAKYERLRAAMIQQQDLDVERCRDVGGVPTTTRSDLVWGHLVLIKCDIPCAQPVLRGEK